MANSVFFDATVLIEIVAARKRDKTARAALTKHGQDRAISALSGHLVMHFGRKVKSVDVLRKFLSDYKILALEPDDFEWAFNNLRDDDFEDALQLAVAIRNGCENFVTFDQKLYQNYKSLPIIEIKLLK